MDQLVKKFAQPFLSTWLLWLLQIPRRPLSACIFFQTPIWFSCWLSKALLIHLSYKFCSLFSASSYMATAPSPAADAGSSEGCCHLRSLAMGLAAGQRLPCLWIKSMLGCNYLLSGESITLAEKKQSYNVSQLNDYGCSTLWCKLQKLSPGTC